MADILNIGLGSLAAFKAALSVTSNNIANASTPYYSRRQTNFTENPFGTGVNVADIQRIYDEQANRYAQSCSSNFSQADTYLQQIQSFEPLLDDHNTNIGKYISDTFQALTDLNRDASSTTNRSLYLSRLANLQQRFQSVDGEIVRQHQNVNLSLQTAASQANQLLGTIVNLNQQVVNTPGTDQSDIMDQREAQVQQLATYLNFTTYTDSSGVLTLTLANGVNLLAQNQQLTTINDPTNPTNMKLALQQGSTVLDITNYISGGQIAGMLNYRTNALDVAQHSLNRVALAFMQSINAQNKLGIDANGNFGGNIFKDINSTGFINNRAVADINNTGSSNLTVSISSVSQLMTSDYSLQIGAGNTYVLTRLADSTVMSSGTLTSTFPQTISADGFSINISSGTFNANDEYLISPTHGAASNMSFAINPNIDSDKLALAWPVATSPSMPQQIGSNGTISVDAIINPSNTSFSIPNQLKPPIQVQFVNSGGVVKYNLMDVSSGTPGTLIEGPLSYDQVNGSSLFPTPGGYDPGYRVSIHGTVQAGDSFNITYNTNMTNDHRNGEALAALYSTGIINNGSTSFGQAYNLLSLDISMKTQQAQMNYTSADTLNTSAANARDQISGVSVEEETMNLVRYQEAYQASAQILQTAKSVFDVIFSVLRG